MLAIVAGLASCQEKNNPDGNDIGTSEAKLGKVCLTVNIAPPTKVTYAESGTDLQPSWVGDETVILVAEGKTYPLIVKLNDKIATLEGEAPKPCNGSLIYYEKASTVTPGAEFSSIAVDYATQNGNAEASVFIAKDVAISADGTGEGTLSNAGAIIGITSARGVPAGAKISKVTVSGTKLSKATVGSDAALTVANDAGDTLEIEIEDGSTVGPDNSISPIYIAIPAGESTRIQKITLHTDKGEWSILGSTAVNGGDYLYVRTNLFGALPGKFSVSPTKQVYFSPGNLWADGSGNFYFEARQYYTDNTFQTRYDLDEWSSTHVTNFYWSKTPSVAYAQGYVDNNTSNSDVFFTNATADTPNPNFKVNDQTNVWRNLSIEEWQYLFNYGSYANDKRPGLYAYGVTVVNCSNCLAIYPDGYDKAKVVKNGSDKAFDTVEKYLAATAEGIVFLPAGGTRTGVIMGNVGRFAIYHVSNLSAADKLIDFVFNNGEDFSLDTSANLRESGSSVRLVSDCN